MLPLRTAQTRSFRAFRNTISSEKYVCVLPVFTSACTTCVPHIHMCLYMHVKSVCATGVAGVLTLVGGVMLPLHRAASLQPCCEANAATEPQP